MALYHDHDTDATADWAYAFATAPAPRRQPLPVEPLRPCRNPVCGNASVAIFCSEQCRLVIEKDNEPAEAAPESPWAQFRRTSHLYDTWPTASWLVAMRAQDRTEKQTQTHYTAQESDAVVSLGQKDLVAHQRMQDGENLAALVCGR